MSEIKMISIPVERFNQLEKENAALRKALEKIAKEGCRAVTIRGELRDVRCVQLAKEALK